jgi:hypothetical protein
MIRCENFFVGGGSWVKHLERHPGACLSEFLVNRYYRMKRKSNYLKSFFASLDPLELARRKRHRRRLRRAEGEPHMGFSAGLPAPKEEPVDETPLPFEDRRYNFCYSDYDV